MKTIPPVFFHALSLFPALAMAATVKVDEARSKIQVDAKATGHGFCGDLQKYVVTLKGDTATGNPSGFDLSWDFNDLKTADEKRDQAMIKWLGGGHPKGSFTFVKSWDETATGGTAQGNLTINGVSKTISFPYTLKRDDEWVTIEGSVTMNYQNFKLPLIRSMAVMTVDPKLVVRFHVVGTVK